MKNAQQGKEPDYRFSLANERTYLAWLRTALAVIAGGVLLDQFGTGLRPEWLRLVVSGTLVVTSGILGVAAFLQWRRNQLAMQLDQPLPRSWLIPGMAWLIWILAAGTTALLLLK
jgi:putative membrane protein